MNQASKKKKEDADRLLESVKEKAKTAREIHLKGFHIASLYVQANEHRIAHRHVQDYISIKPTDGRAHRLLGEIYEALKDAQKAIDSYRRALELNDTQKDLVLKVAELYCHVNCDSERHRFWAERAEKYFPGSAKIYSIMEYIYRKSGKLNNFKTYLQQKLKSRPQDLTLNLKLLQVLIDLQKLQEGQQLCKQVEGARLFDHETHWWQKAFQLYQKLLSSIDEGDQSLDHLSTFCHMLLAINKLVLITLSVPNAAVAQASKLLRIMDRELFRATDYIDASPSCPQQSSAQIVLQEIKAQLYTHLATLITKMCATGSARWADVVGPVTACYLVSAQIPSCKEPKTTDSKGSSGSLDSRVYGLAQCRLSQVCHILNSLVKQQKDPKWLKQCHDKWCSQEGGQLVISQAFGQVGVDPTSSFLTMDRSLVNAAFSELPSLLKTVFAYDQESIKSDPSNLSRLVWVGLRWDIRPDGILPDLGQFLQPIFCRLLFSTKHLDNTSVDNIRLLDIEAFLYCCVHVAKLQQQHLQARGQALPQTLPLSLCRGMCGQQQLEWYSALYCLYNAKASPSDRAKLRLTVQKGLEVIRCRMNHGMETALLIRLGRTFRERMQEVQNSRDGDDKREQWNAFQEMSIMYWQAAMEHLNLLERNQAVPTQQKPFFPHGNRPISADKIQECKDEGMVAIAEYKFQQGQFQQAVTMLDKTKSASGSYLKAQMYLTKADSEAKTPGLEVISSPLTRQGELLDKAKYALFQTMDFIQDQPENPLHDEIQTSLLDIDNRQASLCQEVVQLELEESAAGDTLHRSPNSSRNISCLSDQNPLESASNDPSPRRLAAELRSMNLSHGRLMEENSQLRSLAATHSRILEQNTLLIDKQNTLMESNNALMKQVLDLNVKFHELSAAQAKKPPTPPPPPPPQPQSLPDNINSNRPIIISAQECNLSSPQVPTMHSMGGLGSPMPGMPTAQIPHLYSQQPFYGYYTTPQGYGIAAYDSSGLHPGLVSSTPAMHMPRMPGTSHFMYDDVTPPTEVELQTPTVGDYAHGMEPKPETQPASSLASNAYPQGFNSSVFNDPSTTPMAPEQNITSLPTAPTAATNIPAVGTPSGMQPTPPVSSNKDLVGTSPLLMSMLMDKEKDSTDKPGSITAGTPTKVSSSAQSPATTPTGIFKPKTSESNQKPGFFATNLKLSESGGAFGATSKPSGAPFQAGKASDKTANPTPATLFASPTSATISPNPTSATSFANHTAATSSASSALSNFSFKASQLATSGNNPQKPPTPQPSAATKSASQSPFAGFSFGQIKPSNTMAATFGNFGGKSLNEIPSFRVVADTAKGQQKEECEDNDDDDDDVIFVSEKQPTADQRARAEALMLPPTYFLYEDESPCPGCVGCEPEDLAARGITLSKHSPSPKASRAKEKGGSFGSVATETTGPSGTKEPIQPASIFGNSEASTITFASLTSDKQGTFAQEGHKAFSFAQAGAPVFGNKATEESTVEGQEHDPHFDPIVELPELVDVKTGEEDEEVMYKQRARLYRFVNDLSVWKERGIGDVKLLRHRDTGLLRLIMRREQVLKLCANHRISTDLQLTSMESSDRTWVWHALDYAEREPCHEQFAIKFKTPELAQEFKQRLEELQAARREEEMTGLSGKAEEVKMPNETAETEEKTDAKEGEEESVKTEEPVEETDQEATTGDIFAKFQPKPGDWKCDACLLNNKADAMSCVACMTPKPGAAPPSFAPGAAPPSFASKPPTTSQESGVSATTEDIFAKFKPKPGDWKCDTCLLNNKADALSCVSCTTPKPGAPPPSFASKPPSTSQESGVSVNLSSGGGFSFGNSSFGSGKTSGFQFGGPLPFGSTTSLSTTPGFSFPSGEATFGSKQSESTATTTMEQTPTQESQPTSQFTFGTAFQKFDLGGSGDKASQPVFGSQSPSTGYSFGASSSAATANVASAQQVTPVKPSTGFVFGAKSPTSNTKTSTETSKAFSFTDMAKSTGSTFSFRLDVSKVTEPSPEKTPKPKSPGFLKSPGLNKSGDNEYYKDDDGDHIHFEPVIELPECIAVKTGEEDEISKFSHRAKLFRFDKESSQWKERGIGDIKLLYNPSNRKYRIVMRREQVFKVCANHYVTPELKLEPNAGSTKSWVWMAMDASEDEVQVEQLAVRFKAEEAAQQFKDAIDSAQTNMETGVGESTRETKQDDSEKIQQKHEEKHEDKYEEGQSDTTVGVVIDAAKVAAKCDQDDVARGNDDQDNQDDPDEPDDQNDQDDPDEPDDQNDQDDQDDQGGQVDQDDYSYQNYPNDQDDQNDQGVPDDQGGQVDQDDSNDQGVPDDQGGQVDQDDYSDQNYPNDQDDPNNHDDQVDHDEYNDKKDPDDDDDDEYEDLEEEEVVEEDEDTVQDPKLVFTETGQYDVEIQPNRGDIPDVRDETALGTEEVKSYDQADDYKDVDEGDETPEGQDKEEIKTEGDSLEQEGGDQNDDQGYEDLEKEEKEPTKKAEAAESIVVKSCDPNISKAFSELLRSANASHSQKLQEGAESASQKEQEEGGASSKDDSVSGEGDDIHFEPVAHLPLQVEKITGEEDETQLFCSRAKLYRYDKESSQWKDRGIGDIKILHNPKTGRYRIVMRREQVFKLCANHYITQDMSLLPNAGSENSLVWHAMDVSDGEVQPQQLAVRFKLAGTTQRFKTVFEECQAELRKETDQAGDDPTGDDPSATEPPKPDDAET